MRMQKILCVTLLLLFLAGCSANEASKEESFSQNALDETSIIETTSLSSATDSTELTETTESNETTETTEHNPIHIMSEKELGEALPDGEYFAGILEFDDDCSGATFVINGYYSLTQEELATFEVGDIIRWADEERTVASVDSNSGCSYIHFDDFYYLQNQNNGYCYLRGDYDEIPFYRIAESYHMEFDPGIAVYDYVPLGFSNNEDVLSYAYQYDSIEHLRSDMETVRDQNIHYLAGEEYWVGIDIVVENGSVTKMFLNPAQHQNWIPYELLEDLRPNEG